MYFLDACMLSMAICMYLPVYSYIYTSVCVMYLRKFSDSGQETCLHVTASPALVSLVLQNKVIFGNVHQ